MRQTSTILYLAVDDLIPVGGKPVPGLDEFTAALDHSGIPAVWLTTRTRLQMDDPRRKLGHAHPFVAEDGCGVYLPEDYFHLRPKSLLLKPGKSPTIRLGRFTCLPVAELQPGAADALEALSAETGVPTVPLRSLSPRELAQNLGLPVREAELARQRDFDELFFFAGATQNDIKRYQMAGHKRSIQLRQRGVLSSLAIGASLGQCIRELSRLYDRALRSHAVSIGVGTSEIHEGFSSAFDRVILLTHGDNNDHTKGPATPHRLKQIPLGSPDTWQQLLASLSVRK